MFLPNVEIMVLSMQKKTGCGCRCSGIRLIAIKAAAGAETKAKIEEGKYEKNI